MWAPQPMARSHRGGVDACVVHSKPELHMLVAARRSDRSLLLLLRLSSLQTMGERGAASLPS